MPASAGCPRAMAPLRPSKSFGLPFEEVSTVAKELYINEATWRWLSPRRSLKQTLRTTNAAHVRDCLLGLMILCRDLHRDMAKQEAEVEDLVLVVQSFSDGGRDEAEQRRWREFVVDLNTAAAAILPGDPGEVIEARALERVDRSFGRPIAQRVLAGEAKRAEVGPFLSALTSHIREAADRVTQNQRVIWRLCQIVHDPRIDRSTDGFGAPRSRFLPPRIGDRIAGRLCRSRT